MSGSAAGGGLFSPGVGAGGEAPPASEMLSGLMTSNPNSHAGWGSKMRTEILATWGITATHKYSWRNSSFLGVRRRTSATETELQTMLQPGDSRSVFIFHEE